MKSVRQQRKSGEMGSQQQESAKKRWQIFYPLSKALDCPKREDKKKMPAQVFACKNRQKNPPAQMPNQAI